MSGASRYVIGIDLGTTNVAVAWLDTQAEEARPQILEIEQVTAAGECEARPLLPSFLYLPESEGMAPGSLDLPWATERDYCVGAFARSSAASLPGKTVSSAKSWLCANNVDRLAPILPWNRQNPERQISPVEAAKRLLEHIREAWNRRFGGDEESRFEHQEIVLTVPASFDAVARELTVRAAGEAGLQVVLLEEPQAAFYAWLQEHQTDWRDVVNAGDRILVCDVGGGTTDFSLIEVRDEDGNLSLERIAVGDHILLGGDNMDLTLAMTIAHRLQKERGMRLDNWQLAGLTHACREAKEKLCGDPECETFQLTVLGRGSSLIGGSISTDLTRDEMNRVLVEGFFPLCEFDAKAPEGGRAGLRTFGLQYASDPRVTRHLASFLSRHSGDAEAGLPGAILFNGGVSKALPLRDRIAEALSSWRGGETVGVLAGTDPDLAVAVGACAYGSVRRGNAIRIKAGSSHACFIGVESSLPAVPGFAPPTEGLCVVPFGMEEGTDAEVPFSGLGLVVGEPTEFRFFQSTERTEDELGQVLPDVEELAEMPALRASLPVDEATPAGTLVPVRLQTVLSEIGTVQIWCREEGGERSWKLEFDLRAASGPGEPEDEGEA